MNNTLPANMTNRVHHHPVTISSLSIYSDYKYKTVSEFYEVFILMRYFYITPLSILQYYQIPVNRIIEKLVKITRS